MQNNSQKGDQDLIITLKGFILRLQLDLDYPVQYKATSHVSK